jgi:hypothetical protein
LAALASAHNAVVSLSFTYLQSELNNQAGGLNLLNLLQYGGTAQGFSGTITAVPESSTSLAGFGALGLVLLGIGFRSRRSGVIRIG